MCLQCSRPEFDSWVRKIPWRRKWQPTPGFLPGESYGQRSLAVTRVGHDLVTKPTPPVYAQHQGFPVASFSLLLTQRSSGVYSDEHNLQPLSPALLMLTGIIKTLLVSSSFDLLKNTLGLWLSRKLTAGYPEQRSCLVTDYSHQLIILSKFHFKREIFSYKKILNTK